MTHALRETTNYINSCIKSMNRTVEFAKTIDGHDRDWKVRWALDTIENECYKGFGALQVAQIYLELIEEADKNKLSDRLFDAWKEANDRVWKEIK